MADYLIQDSTLTDIADAIRAKDGSSAPILTEDMASAIAAIPTDGGAMKYVEGTFTLVNDARFPTITHNLGTSKIAGFVVPHHSIVAHSGYRNYLSFFMNWIPFTDGEAWTKDFTPYNSTKFPNVITVNGFSGLVRDTGYASPWATQSSQWNGTYYAGLSVTDTTVRVGTGTEWCSGTYYYRIWALE